MTFYKGHIEFSDGREFDDYYVNKEEAISYYERSPHYKNCIRAELFEMIPDESNCKYEEGNCLFEFDVNGNYYYDIKTEVAAC